MKSETNTGDNLLLKTAAVIKKNNVIKQLCIDFSMQYLEKQSYTKCHLKWQDILVGEHLSLFTFEFNEKDVL